MIVKTIEETGYPPAPLNTDPIAFYKERISFGTGIAGFIPTLLLATDLRQLNFEIDDVKRIKSAALHLGSRVWTRVQELDKPGLLDGLSGCGYALHCIARHYYNRFRT